MIYVHDLSQYALGTKDAEPAGEDSSSTSGSSSAGAATTGGTRQTVCAALVAHVHRHPVVLMLQDTASGEYRLPGGAVPAGEDEVVVLCRTLDAALAPPPGAPAPGPVWRGRVQPERLLATYWRPHAARDVYPYLPVHVTTPAERINVYLAELPERCALACARGTRLVAVPFYDLYGASTVFGTIPSALPTLLSRYEFICC